VTEVDNTLSVLGQILKLGMSKMGQKWHVMCHKMTFLGYFLAKMAYFWSKMKMAHRVAGRVKPNQ